MGKYLVINGGSSSLKFQLLEMTKASEVCLAEGLFEKIGLDDPMMSIKHYVDGKFIKEDKQKTFKEWVCLEDGRVYEYIGKKIIHGKERHVVQLITNNLYI